MVLGSPLSAATVALLSTNTGKTLFTTVSITDINLEASLLNFFYLYVFILEQRWAVETNFASRLSQPMV